MSNTPYPRIPPMPCQLSDRSMDARQVYSSNVNATPLNNQNGPTCGDRIVEIIISFTKNRSRVKIYKHPREDKRDMDLNMLIPSAGETRQHRMRSTPKFKKSHSVDKGVNR